MKLNWKSVLIFLLLLAIVPGILLGVEVRLPSLYGESYYAELPELYDRLVETEDNKVVIIGGSSVAFGVDTSLLEDLMAAKGYDYTVCCFGLYAAVGTSAMLDLSLDTLKEGDIVVLSFEPVSEAMSTYFGATAFLKCAEDDPSLVTKLSSSRQSSVVGNYLSCLQERYAIVQSGNYPQAEGVYSKAAFDDSGNMTYQREGNILTLGFDTSSPIDLTSLSIEEAFAQQVADFCTEVADRGVTVYYSFCPMNRSAMTDDSSEVLEAFYQLCDSTFPCSIISNPENYTMDSGWFYDSNFHLNSAGAQKRTIQLAKDLLGELGCYEALNIDDPSMPDPMRTAAGGTGVADNAAGDNDSDSTDSVNVMNVDAACFLYESIAGAGYKVSGLTEEGKTRTSLTVPSSYEGLPVVGLTEDALKDSLMLEELILPATIETLPDHLAENCPSLTRLILSHTDSPCQLSEHSLDNAARLKIFVPAEAYSLYRDGYGCQENRWTHYLSQVYTY